MAARRAPPAASSPAATPAPTSASRARTGAATPLHDHSDQYQAFGYLDHILDDTSRVSLIAGTSQEQFQIPNVSGLQPDLGFSQNGVTAFPSREAQPEPEGRHQLRDRHLPEDHRANSPARPRSSRAIRSCTTRPTSPANCCSTASPRRRARPTCRSATQLEGVYKLTDAHTLRGGRDRLHRPHHQQDQFAGLRPGRRRRPDRAGAGDHHRQRQRQTPGPIRPIWRTSGSSLDSLTLNYGLRFDQLDAFRHENQLSPRVNLVWTPMEGTTFHAGYARYFSPPPFELVASHRRSLSSSAPAPRRRATPERPAACRSATTTSTSACSRSSAA